MIESFDVLEVLFKLHKGSFKFWLVFKKLVSLMEIGKQVFVKKIKFLHHEVSGQAVFFSVD
ncbi:hypothetical protein C900_05761 [Fulvivirga imtechensis AK7]|uniref:Uncharacterized protein n=1 Tax=Fulvivirga imtechensis AK7 TaxID=1237149 RepID=L8JVP3_9BACT|nr:hypothetical protein C900_05761 [Fulvivirga imtechensis AK7]